MRKATIFIVLAFLLVLGAAPVYAAIPKLPHAFYDSVIIDGSPAPDSTQISATVNIGDIIATQNPVATVGGSYGIGNPYLLVQGYDIPDGATITFNVTNANGTVTGGTATFVAGGGPTRHDLSVTIAAPESPPENGNGAGAGAPAPAPPSTVAITLFGSAATFSINSEGVIQETFTATSADGILTITIPAGTIALDKDGEPLSSLTAAVDLSPSDPPAGDNIIGLVYDFGPEGATFEPPITFTFTYDPDEVSEGAELVIMKWDEDADAWAEVPAGDYTVDTETNTITLSVSGFSKYAIIARAAPVPPLAPTVLAPAAFSLSDLTVQPAEIETGKAVTITVTVANTGGTQGSYTIVLKLNGVKEAEKNVTIAAGSSEIVTFSVAREEAGSYSVTVNGLSAGFTVVAPAPPPPPPGKEEVPEAPAKPINWPLISGIIAAVVVVALLIFFLVRRRAY